MNQESMISRINISPLAKNIAEGKNIDISKITGTGPGGRIVKEDVENYIKNLEIQKGRQPAVQLSPTDSICSGFSCRRKNKNIPAGKKSGKRNGY